LILSYIGLYFSLYFLCSNAIFDSFFDCRRVSLISRARYSFICKSLTNMMGHMILPTSIVMMVLNSACWGWQLCKFRSFSIIMKSILIRYQIQIRYTRRKPSFDWVDNYFGHGSRSRHSGRSICKWYSYRHGLYDHA